MEYPKLDELVQSEIYIKMCESKFHKIPLWRLFRGYTRYNFLSNCKFTSLEWQAKANSLFSKHSIFKVLNSYIISFGGYIKSIVFRKSYENVFFSLSRLNYTDYGYIDKFVDPIVAQMDIKASSIIYQMKFAKNIEPRYNTDIIRNVDFIIITSQLIAIVISPIILLRYFKKISQVYNKAVTIYGTNSITLFAYARLLGDFIVSSFLYKILFKAIKPKRIFVVNRNNYLPQIYVSKKLNITSYELQHGVTHAATPAYAGIYDSNIDVDFFLTFGEAWLGNQFYMPIDNMINIGWAYKDFLKNMPKPDKINDDVLVISSPEISSFIATTICELADIYPNIQFALRLHPEEVFSMELTDKIKVFSNIYFQDNTEESWFSLSKYKYVLGENSSVLYEAISMGNRVGRICFNGLTPTRLDGVGDDGFTYLYSAKDFDSFLDIKESDKVKQNDRYYSDFNYEAFKKILN